MTIHDEELSAAHDAFNRLRRAERRRSGCYLTAEMVASLALTSVGQMWNDVDPRAALKGGAA